MPTKTHTSNQAAEAAAQLAAGLLDESTIAAMANELYRTLPSATGGSMPAGVASAPVSPEPVSTNIPSASEGSRPTNAIAANGVPDSIAQDGRTGGNVQGVPQGYAAALPLVNQTSPPMSTSPFYFLNQSNGYHPQPGRTQPTELPGDRVTAQPYGMPGTDALQTILSGITVGHSTNGTASAVPAARPDSDRQFYFVDPIGEKANHPATREQNGALFDVYGIRRDFPILHQKVHGKPLIWLDSAATSQKPQAVIDAESYFYEHDNSNIHRAAHALAARATDAYEGARQKVQQFLGASSPDEIVFVRGTTEGVNLLAQTCGRQRIGPGDEILLTHYEHHANIVPWQMLAKEKGATLKVVPINDQGELMLNEYAKLLGPRTRIVAIGHVSNTLGTVAPVELMTAMAHQIGAAVVIDGAQSVPHLRVNVSAIDCDFLVFSGHKLFAPTGIGILYGKKALLEQMPPWQGGGNMIDKVTFEHTTYNKVPYKFEAGTGNIAGAVGLGAAVDYLNKIGFDAAIRHEDQLVAYAMQGLATIPGVRLFGTAPHKVGVTSFVLEGTKPEEVGQFLDQEGIAVRAGHHCAQPTMQRFGVEGMVRPSFAFYNTFDEVDTLIAAVWKAKKVLT